ncbi:hypothetical protein ACHAXM_002231 [Skeletonema potamos]|jgi:hypothetical protein
MPTFAYVGTPVRPGAVKAKQEAQEGNGLSVMAKVVEIIPTTALLPSIGSGPLQDVSNSSLHLSMKVSEKWTAGKGKRQTSQCQAAIRLCLLNGLRNTEIAQRVSAKYKHLGLDFQAREYQRAHDLVDRVKKKLWLAHSSRFNSNKEAGFFV